MAHEGSAPSGVIDSEEDGGDALEEMCNDILERRLKEGNKEDEKIRHLEEFPTETGMPTSIDANLPDLAIESMQQLDEMSKSDLQGFLSKEVIFDDERTHNLFSYGAVKKILDSINKCRKLRIKRGRKFKSSECCGFCEHYGRYLLFGISVCPEKECVEQLSVNISHVKECKRFTGHDVLAVFVNWGLKTCLLSTDLKFTFAELSSEPSSTTTTMSKFPRENWNAVFKCLLSTLDLIKFDNKLEMKTLLKVFLMVSVSEGVQPEYSPYLEQCIKKLHIRIVSENWSEEEVCSLVDFLYDKSINLYAQIAIAEKLNTPTKRYSLSSSLAFLIMQDYLSCNITKEDPGVLCAHIYTVLEKWKPLQMSLKDTYFLVKCLRMCISAVPSGADKWELLRYTERWLDELKLRMRCNSMDSIKVQYYILQVVADWYKKYPDFVQSLSKTSPLYNS